MATSLSRRHLLGIALGGATALGAGGVAVSLASGGAGAATRAAAVVPNTFLTADRVHPLAVTADPGAITTALRTYKATGVKEWIEADVTIDGSTYRRAGIRLKGNSSLRSAAESTPPATLPWLVRLDKYVKGVSHGGLTELVVRSNSTATSLNEAVALDLLGAAGLATQQSAYVRLSVNGSSDVLRLAVENPAGPWAARVFPTDGLLYKSEASGNWTYRGPDAASYDDVFDQESGDDDLTPLIGFLRFLNTSTDAEFTAGLGSRVDVDAFATYLAFEELLDNFDDIDGPGNNSYLWWARPTGRMTVVAWDHNLAFRSRPGAAGTVGAAGQPGQQGQPGGRQAPAGGLPQAPASTGQLPAGQNPAGQQGGRTGGMNGKANPLVDRFTTLLDGTARVAAAKDALRRSLYTSGLATRRLAVWTGVIETGAQGLVDATTLASERQAIEKYVA